MDMFCDMNNSCQVFVWLCFQTDIDILALFLYTVRIMREYVGLQLTIN